MRLFRLLFMIRLAFGCFPSINQLGPNVQSTTTSATTSSTTSATTTTVCPTCSTTITNNNAFGQGGTSGTVQVTGSFCQGTTGVIAVTCASGTFLLFDTVGNGFVACTAAAPCFAMCTSAGVFGLQAGVAARLLGSVACAPPAG